MTSSTSAVRRRAALVLAVPALLALLVLGFGTPAGAQVDTPAAPPTPPPTISAGGTHTCAVVVGGTLQCWGQDNRGQATPPVGTFELVGAGARFSCGLVSGGTVTCWGHNNLGQTDAPAGTFGDLDVGVSHSCAVADGGALTCWGLDDYGQSTAPPGTYLTAAAGRFHSCAILDDGSLDCWGRNDYGQADPPPGTDFEAVTAGDNHSCALRTGGVVECWGQDTRGQASPPGDLFDQIDAGGQHTCGVKTDGTADCWGRDDVGQSSPPAGTFSQVSAGARFSCGITTGGLAECWGDNTYGQSEVVVTSAPPATGYVNLPYEHQFTTTHLAPAPTFSFTSGSPAPGLALDADGTLAGTPTGTGAFPGEVSATDTGGLGVIASQSFTHDIEVFNGLAGFVTEDGSGDPLAGIRVRVWDASTDAEVADVLTGSNGFWSVPGGSGGISADTYKVSFGSPQLQYFAEWYDDAPTRGTATPVVYDGINGIDDVSAALAPASSVSGLVREAGTGVPLSGITVKVRRASDLVQVDKAVTGPDGRYTVQTIPAGTYLVEATGNATHLTKWWFNSLDQAGATPLVVPSRTDVTGINVNLLPAGSIVGQVEDGSAVGIAGAQVTLLRSNGTVLGSTSTDGMGAYTFAGLAPGSYKLRFSAPGYVTEFWNDKASAATADLVVVSSGGAAVADATLSTTT